MSARYPLPVQIGEIEREIRTRESLHNGLMCRGIDATHRIDIMRQVLLTLQELRDKNGASP